MINLFQKGDFTLSSGYKSKFKIDCDALTLDDWDTLALVASKMVGPFGSVIGVPKGGLLFAKALEQYKSSYSNKLIIAEDVVTTGGSMEKIRIEEIEKGATDISGITVFCRGKCPYWVRPIFSLDGFLGGLI